MAAEEKCNLAMVEVERLKTLIQGHQNEGKQALHFVLHLQNKTHSPCFHSLVKTDAIVRENSRADHPFHLLENSHKVCRGFHQAMTARRTCFIFRLNKEKDDIRSMYSNILYFLS